MRLATRGAYRYSGGPIMKLYRSNRYVRAGMTAARVVANPTARRIMRGTMRGVMSGLRRRARKRSYIRRQKRQIGSLPNSSTANKHLTCDHNQIGVNTKTLYINQIVDMPRYQGVNNILRHQRARDTVTVNGFKFCVHVVNETALPLYYHFAILQRKNENDTANLFTDFFRNPANGHRSTDAAQSLTGMEWHCNNINTDVLYINCHYKICINPGDGTGGYNPNLINYYHLDKYFKIGKQFRFNDGTCETPLLLVEWYSQPDEIGGSAPKTNVAKNTQKGHTYFRNPRV